VGLVTLLVADKVQHAVLLEPNPLAAERAKENLRLNHLDFQVVAQALSDRVGNVELENAAGVSSCSRTVDGFNTLLPTITVPRTTFDQFLRERGQSLPPVSAVKIDVEGHENSVLRGMTDFLKSRRPKLVMFEYLQRTDIVETLRIFRDVDYSVFELSFAGPQAVTKQVNPLQDLFACRLRELRTSELLACDSLDSVPATEHLDCPLAAAHPVRRLPRIWPFAGHAGSNSRLSEMLFATTGHENPLSLCGWRRTS
jgi:FkbM family methyltransferase